MRIANALKLVAVFTLLEWSLPAVTHAQYVRKDLTSNQSGVAPNVNSELINAWGLVQLGTSPIWLSDRATAGANRARTGRGGSRRHADGNCWQHGRELRFCVH